MDANNLDDDFPTDEEKYQLRYKVLRLCRTGEPTKTDLSRAANKVQMPTAWIHEQSGKLIAEGMITKRKKPALGKRGPNPEVYKITEKGLEEYRRMINGDNNDAS